jgi:hypothetical protein
MRVIVRGTERIGVFRVDRTSGTPATTTAETAIRTRADVTQALVAEWDVERHYGAGW